MPEGDAWSEEMADVLLGIARGEFSARMTRTGQRDRADAIAFLINTTAQEIERLFNELSETNLRLRNTQAQLVQAGKLAGLGQLSGAVAHELNNPLMSVSLTTKLILDFVRNMDLPDDQGTKLLRYIERVQAATERCAQVVSALLAFGRQTKGDRHLIDLSDVVRSTLELVGHKLHLANVSVALDLPATELRVNANANQLGQVILNLVLNAAGAMPEGGELTVVAAERGDEVRLSIRDGGPGIPDEVQRRMFEPFFTTKPAGVGTGLGLAISHGIVEEHDGRIEVDSTMGEGSTFTLVFPKATTRS